MLLISKMNAYKVRTMKIYLLSCLNDSRKKLANYLKIASRREKVL